jgi:hypothetical protein
MTISPAAHISDEPVDMLTAPPPATVLHPLPMRTLPLPDAPAAGCCDDPTHTEPLDV